MSTTPSVGANGISHGAFDALDIRSLSPSFTVNDIQKSLAWYRDVLGFTVEQEYTHEGTVRAVALKAGAVQLMIGQDDGAKGFDRVKGEGFSVRLTTTQNVDAIARRITERGGTLDTAPADMPWGARVFRVRDPDGFKLVISSE